MDSVYQMKMYMVYLDSNGVKQEYSLGVFDRDLEGASKADSEASRVCKSRGWKLVSVLERY